MKKLRYLAILLMLALILCACQGMLYPTDEHASAGLQSSLNLQTSSKPQPSTTKPNPTTTAPELPLPETCSNGHTFPGEDLFCTVCGIDYYSTVLQFLISRDCKSYAVVGLGDCQRTTVVVPETYNGLPVEEIRNLTATHESSIGNAPEANVTHVVLPSTIKSIGVGAFVNYASLISINIPDGITEIENTTFLGCESLISLTLPKSVTFIGDRAFANCTNLKDLQIPEGVTYIGDSAFAGCKNLASIEIPDSVTTIGNSVFQECDALTGVVIPDAITEIGISFFYECRNLESVVVGKGVKSFAHNVFDSCDKLKTIYYRGTQAEWAQIRTKEYINSEEITNPQFENITIYFLSETPPTEEGNFWYYVDGIPTPWKSKE